MLKFFTLTLALPLVMFLFPFDSNDGKPPSQFVFNADEGILTLRGNWKFQTGDDPRWSRPDFPDADWRTMAVPGMWVRELEKNYGIAWYRAWVEIPAKVDTAMQWGFNIIQVNVAADIFWDGALMARHGTVGISQAAEVPSQSNHLYVIPTRGQMAGRHLIALRVSNFHAPSGGFFRPPEFGPYQDLFISHIWHKTWFGFLAGLFFLSSVYHLILFL